MAKRDKRQVRFSTLKTFYKMFQAEVLSDNPEENLAKAKANVQFSNVVLFTSEIEKFQAQNPEVDMTDFLNFCEQTGALKKSGAKGGGGGKPATRLNTPEAAVERGVDSDSVDEYVGLVNQIYETAKAINALMPADVARVSFAIPVKHKKS